MDQDDEVEQDVDDLDDFEAMDPEQYQKAKMDKFALKPIYKKEEIKQRLHEV